jgi:hypothetical protein
MFYNMLVIFFLKEVQDSDFLHIRQVPAAAAAVVVVVVVVVVVAVIVKR